MTFFRLSLGWRFEAGGRAQCGADVNVAVINEGELCKLFVRFFSSTLILIPYSRFTSPAHCAACYTRLLKFKYDYNEKLFCKVSS